MIFDKNINMSVIGQNISLLSDDPSTFCIEITQKFKAASLRIDNIESVLDSGVITDRFIYSLYKTAYCYIIRSNATFILARQYGQKNNLYIWRAKKLLESAALVNDIINHIFDEYKKEHKQ